MYHIARQALSMGFSASIHILQYAFPRASLVAQKVKSLPAMQETWVQSLGGKIPLEKEMATHSSVLAWRIPMDKGAWPGTVHGVAESLTRLSDFTICLRILQTCGQPRQHIKKQRHYFVNKSLYSQSYGFSSGHVGL
ncbi:unnamed protein product [Rangifer tarandus platyrhynchus]|uniref:Uncharacterized protein n=1 Tax=Rangifer tarandus platyrhynchus TaxID=3082113 RepID=A0ACB1KHY0_RANTA